MKDRFPDYYYSRTSNPHRFTGNGLGKVYSADLMQAVDREQSLEPVRRLQDLVRGQKTLDAMLYIDTKTWLPDDLLIKADKMTMANSIELRVPLLDHRVLEFAASLPSRLKLNGHNTKYILKKALSKRIPREISNRKKAGFPVPYGSWLRKDLKDVRLGCIDGWPDDEPGLFQQGCGRELAEGERERHGLLQGDILSAYPGTVAKDISGERTSCSLVDFVTPR